MNLVTLLTTLLVALVSSDMISGELCNNPISYKWGSLNILSCYKQETSKFGMKLLKMTQHVYAESSDEPLLKYKRTIKEELVECQTLAGIRDHKISDFECLKYHDFVNDSIFTNTIFPEDKKFLKKFTLISKSEMLGSTKIPSQLDIYPLCEEAIDDQALETTSKFLGNRSDLSTTSAYFVLTYFGSMKSEISGDIHLSVISSEYDIVNLEYPGWIVWIGAKITDALDHGYVLSLKNVVFTVPIIDESMRIKVNFTVGQRDSFPYFFLENTVTTNIPNMFDYNAFITQENITDRYSTDGSYSTLVNIDALSKIPALNFSLRQKFQNSGPELDEWYETMILNSQHFTADVVSIAEDGFSKRLHVADKEGRTGLEISYNGPTSKDEIDFNIHLKKSVLTGIFAKLSQEFMGF